MPGLAIILGQVDKAPQVNGAPLVTSGGLQQSLNGMLRALTLPGHQALAVIDPELSLAMGQTWPAQGAAKAVGYAHDRQIVSLLEGELANATALAGRFGLPPDCAQAAVVAESYAREDAAGLEKLRGHWAAVVVDRSQRRVVVANDAAGVRALYLARTRGGAWVLASTPAAVLAHGDVARQVDAAGLADVLAFSFALGTRTLFEGVECLPPASILTWDGSGELQRRQHWQLTTHAPARAPSRGDVKDLERIRQMFNAGVAEMAAMPGPLTLALSGGMDSRGILSALVAGGASFQTLTHSIEEASDAHLSVQLAKLANATHHFYKVTGEGLTEHLVEGVRMMGGRMFGVDVHPLCFLEDIATYSGVVFTGMGGAVYKVATSGSRLAAETEDPTALSGEIFRSYNKALNVERDFPALLRPEVLAQIGGLPVQSVQRAVLGAARRGALRGVSGLVFFEERMRKLLSKGDMIVRRDVETRHPLLAPEVIEAVHNLPYAVRADGGLLRYVVTRNAPALAALPYERDGRPMRYMFTAWERLQDRAAREVQRFRKRWKLGGQPRRVYSYRYGDWIRGPLAGQFRDVLLDARTLSRPYWRGETIEGWLNEHAAGGDRAAQLSLLFALELTLRECLDPAPAGANVVMPALTTLTAL